MGQFTKEEGTEIEILHVDNRTFLRVGESSVEVKDYKISSSMHGGTELEVVIPMNSELTEFLMSARQESPLPQTRKSTNSVP